MKRSLTSSAALSREEVCNQPTPIHDGGLVAAVCGIKPQLKTRTTRRSLLPIPPELMCQSLLYADNATLTQALTVAKVCLRALVSVCIHVRRERPPILILH